MSAIVGIFYRDGRLVDPASLQGMVDILAHRGPDGASIWHQDSVGLGHRMLWTTPESLHETLPLEDQQANLVITADARIDNREELGEALSISPQAQAELSDSQFILAAYRKWGEDCPQKLLGDFAFVIWDGRKRSLFCARDHFGVKPLYYYLADSVFVFATEIKAILTLTQVPRKLNEIRVGDYLTANFDDLSITFYQGILRVPASHTMTVSREGMRLQRYWSLNPTFELRLESDEEYAIRFREIFTESVRCRLRSAFPIGAMLSGGMDSSSVACVARNLLLQDSKELLLTISGIFDNVPECDERSFINTVLAQGGFNPHYCYRDRQGPFSLIDEVLWYEDEAFYGVGLGLSWEFYRTAKKKSLRILLDGHGGDEAVSLGYEYLNELALSGQWLTLRRELSGLAKNGLIDYSPWSVLTTALLNKTPGVKLGRRLWQALRRRIHPEQKARSTNWHVGLNKDFIERIGLKMRHQAHLQFQANSAKTEKEGHYHNLTSGLQSLALEMLDKAAAASAIESRYPFWDKRLVEFCLSVPARQKLYHGWTRMILRRAMEGILPREIQWRTGKMNFGPSISYGLLTYDQERLDELISHPEVIEPYIDIPALREVYDRFVTDGAQATPEDMSIVISRATLGLWLRSVQALFAPNEAL